MAATIKGYAANGSGPTYTDVDQADSGSITYGRDDNVTSTTALPIPTATGTHFSWVKWLVLYCTATSSTTISNKKVNLASALATGLALWYGTNGGGTGTAVTYTQNNGTQGTAAGNYPADSGSNGATPANNANYNFTQMATTATVFDSSSSTDGSTGPVSHNLPTVLAVDDTYTGGGGTASLPNLILTYDEQ